jgi:hypothetical protein
MSFLLIFALIINPFVVFFPALTVGYAVIAGWLIIGRAWALPTLRSPGAIAFDSYNRFFCSGLFHSRPA